jgi:hypothetical protein
MSCLESLIELLEAEAQKQKLSKKALAERTGLHPNTLRGFGGKRRAADASPSWRPQFATLRAIENILFPDAQITILVQRSRAKAPASRDSRRA